MDFKGKVEDEEECSQEGATDIWSVTIAEDQGTMLAIVPT